MSSEGGAVAVEIPEPPPPFVDGKPKPESEPNPSLRSRIERCLGLVWGEIPYIIMAAIIVPPYLIYAGAAWLFRNINVIEDSRSDRSHSQAINVYGKVKKIVDAIGSRLTVFMSMWIIINLSVPRLRKMHVLGSELWKWTLLVALVTWGYNIITILTWPLIYSLCSNHSYKRKKSLVYYVIGLRQSVNLVILSALILVAWVSYFRTSHGIKKNDDTDTILPVCTWSFVMFAVTTVLWLLKNALLLKWEADKVYDRFRERILIGRWQIYFLQHICEWHLGLLQPKIEGDEEETMFDGDDQSDIQDWDQVAEKDREETSSIANEKIDLENRKEKEEKKAKGALFLDKHANKATLYDIKKITEYFVDLFKVTYREEDNFDHVVNQCEKIDTDHNITERELMVTFEFEIEDARKLYNMLKQEHNSSRISYRDFEMSMVKAHNNCVALGHTLLDAREVVGVLNNVMTVLLFVIVFIAWLLLTDIATTKILVLIASPLLAVTFVFGDTCKKIFEGIIFSFITHPFDVGDRCIIDKIELEVKRVSVLTTTFAVIGKEEEAVIGKEEEAVIGKEEEALYPNSALAMIPIINLKGDLKHDFDPSDSVEVTLHSYDAKLMLDKLHLRLNRFFEDDRGRKFKKANSIIVKDDRGRHVKMEIQFYHVMTVYERTPSQYLKKKEQQKSELSLWIKKLIEEIKGDYNYARYHVVIE